MNYLRQEKAGLIKVMQEIESRERIIIELNAALRAVGNDWNDSNTISEASREMARRAMNNARPFIEELEGAL